MNSKTYSDRRKELRKNIKNGAILLLGLNEASRNYLANAYPFRQDSHFLYYTGINLPNTALVLLSNGQEILFGTIDTMDDIIWTGPRSTLSQNAEAAGISRAEDILLLSKVLSDLISHGETIHYLPPYRAEQTFKLAAYLDMPIAKVPSGASEELIYAISRQRSIKTDDEAAEIEDALTVSKLMYQTALQNIKPGKIEAEIAGLIQGVALSKNCAQAFLPIVSIHGEVLHNNYYGNIMKEGDILVIDAGAESPHFYASDITRAFPVSGQFTLQQKEIYQIVLDAQLAVISAASPQKTNRDLHLLAARTITAGLKEVGLMKGDIQEAVDQGAHALFFPHGIGHMLGLDVHDMEDLGDAVGYAPGETRSAQFGLSFLRLARKLEPGFVITVEPGIYFIPPLIDLWESEKKHEAFINYSLLSRYRNFGGIRIEDNILITNNSCRVLGSGIPKTINEIEGEMKKN